MTKVLVEVTTCGGWAPGYCSFSFVSAKHARTIQDYLTQVTNGELTCDDALLDWETAFEVVPKRHHRWLEEGYNVRFKMDAWEAFSMFGHGAGDALA